MCFGCLISIIFLIGPLVCELGLCNPIIPEMLGSVNHGLSRSSKNIQFSCHHSSHDDVRILIFRVQIHNLRCTSVASHPMELTRPNAAHNPDSSSHIPPSSSASWDCLQVCNSSGKTDTLFELLAKQIHNSSEKIGHLPTL